MFDQMRRNTKTILWVTVIAFVGLIFLAWGADFQLGGKTKRVAGQIGLINGQPVMSQVYEQAVAQARTRYQEQAGRDIDDRTDVMIRNQTWDEIVQDVLLRQEVQRRGIRATDEEVVRAVLEQPPSDVMQSPNFQTDGKFDLAKYQAALRDPNVDTRAIEAQYRSTLPLQKLQLQVMGSVSVSDPELWGSWQAQNDKIKVSFVLVPLAKFNVDEAALSRADLEQFYQSHQSQYRMPPQAVLQFISLPRRYTEQDSLNLVAQAQQILQENREGEDFSVLVDAYSEAPPALRGGDAATWLTEAQLSDPAVRDAAFGLQVGEVSGVLLGRGGLHILKVQERKTDPTGNQVKVADILLPLKPSPETLSQLRDTILQFHQEAESRDFAEVAREMKLELKESAPFGETGYIPGLGAAPELQTFAFSQPAGAISPVIERPDDWVVARLKMVRPAGVAGFDEIQDRLRVEVADSLRCDQASREAEALLRQAQAGTPLAAVVKSDPSAVFETPEPFTRLSYPKGIGGDPVIIGRLFAAPVGLIPTVLRGRTGAFVATVEQQIPADREQFEAQKAQLRKRVMQQRQNQLLTEWLASLKKSAKIEDYRFGGYES